MPQLDHLTGGQFRPVSQKDFSRYAKSLAWLLEEPLQRTQELLAHIYGYSSCHELQQIFKTPGEPGPFDYEWIGVIPSRLLCKGTNPSNRRDRVLQLVAEFKGLPDFDGMQSRWCNAGDIGLFEPPDEHRRAFRIVKAKVDLLEALERDDPAQARYPYEYATLGTTITDPGEYVLHFTDIGQAVFDAVSYIGERHEWQPEESAYDVETVTEKLDAITRLHPNTPWSRAAKVCFLGSLVESMDAAAVANLLADAKRAVEIFEALYDGHEKKAAPHNLVTLNADTYFWPAVLYWGGVVALEIGEMGLAKRWLKLNAKLCPQDNFGAQALLQNHFR